MALLAGLLATATPAQAQGVQTHQFTGWPMRLHGLDFLLVAPNGRSSLLLSDVAGWHLVDQRLIIRDTVHRP